MQFTDEQKQAVRTWASEGSGLSEIQKNLAAEFGLSLTFMDVRFLVIELGLDLKDKPQRAAAQPGALKKPASAPVAEEPVFGGTEEDGAPLPGASRVSVSVDRLMKPGSVVSGTVTFSDGVSGRWFLDQLGRLGLESDKAGYKPSRADVEDFQAELRGALEKQGF
jgi:hypothetical protein